jgi:hypothetical protein
MFKSVSIKKLPLRYYITFLYCLGPDIVAGLIVLGIRIVKGGRLFWENGLWCEIADTSWRGMSGGVVGHGGWLGNGRAGKLGVVDTKTEFHEHEHVYQFEVACLRLCLQMSPVLGAAHFVGCALLMWVIFLILWIPLGVLLWIVPGLIQAWIRGMPAYRQSIHERGAYAISEKFERQRLGLD